MLDVLHRGASTWISKLLLGILIVSFGVWGIADVFRGFGSNTAYHVGSREIGVVELDQNYQRELQQYSRRLNRPVNKDEALKTGLSQQILSKIVTDATIEVAARAAGLSVSDATIREQIVRDPAFKGPNGAFDRARFADLLRSNGWNEDMYVLRRRADLQRSQLLDGLAGGQPAPKVFVEALDQYRNEARTVRFATLAAASLGEIAAPSEAELEKFFSERARAFRAPETRSLTALVLDAAAIARPDDVTDDDAKAEYTRQASRFTTPEKRRVLQIVFADSVAADAALAEIRAGKSFEDVAEALGQKREDIDLGEMSRDKFVDAKVAEAAFALPEVGAVSGVVAGKTSTVVLKLVASTPGKTTDFAAAAADLKREIAQRRAESDVLSRHDQIEDALAGGAKLDAVAERFGMKLVTLAKVDRNGRLADGTPATGLPKLEDVLRGAFESDVGVENDPIDLGGHGFLWYALTAVDPARDLAFGEVRDRVLAQWRTEETTRRLAQTAEALIDRIRKGEAFDAVVTGAGLTATVSEPFHRGETVAALPAAAVTAAFDGAEGHVAAVAAPNGDHVLLQVDDVTPSVFFAEAEGSKQLADQAGGSYRSGLLETWLVLEQKEIGVTANPAVIGRITGRVRE